MATSAGQNGMSLRVSERRSRQVGSDSLAVRVEGNEEVLTLVDEVSGGGDLGALWTPSHWSLTEKIVRPSWNVGRTAI